MNRSTKKVVLFWMGLFLLVNLVCELWPNTNPFSRYVVLLSLVEEQSFQIDNYIDYTVDWAQTPDDHYYSNKAPGPTLLAFPLFFIMDKVVTRKATTADEHREARLRFLWGGMKWLSFLLQALPFAILCYFFLSWLAYQNVSHQAITLSCIALLFGHTATLFMNTFFGHGVTATFMLGLALALLNNRWGWVGFCFGWALLSDYSMTFAIVPVGLLLWSFNRKTGWTRPTFRFLLGGVIPGALWIFYHQSCFGGIFALPSQFQNPEFVDGTRIWWGAINPIPDLAIVGELLFGLQRGILWTQPWVFLVIVSLIFLLWQQRNLKWNKGDIKLVALGFPTLFFLIWMNSGFNGWHGGNTPGPRYLSPIFPVFACLLGLQYDRLRPYVRVLAWSLVGTSLIFFMLVYTTDLYPMPGELLWPRYVKINFIEPARNVWIRLPVLAFLFLIGIYFTWKHTPKKRYPLPFSTPGGSIGK